MSILKFITTFILFGLSHLVWGLTIHLHPLPKPNGLSDAQLQCLQQGVAVFERNLKDDVVLNIGVTLIPFHAFNYPSAFQAGFLTNKLPIKQIDVYKLLAQDAKSSDDKRALKSLLKYRETVDFLSLGFINAYLNINADTHVYNNNNNNNKIRLVPSANIKAIDPHFKFENYGRNDAKFVLTNASKPIVLDGIVLLNAAYPFKFPSMQTDNEAYDPIAVVNHEILGILGLQSTVLVTIEEGAMPKCRATSKCLSKKTFEETPLGSIIDLFRYSQKSAQSQIVDWSITHKADKERIPYFSIDGGKTALMYFSFGETNSREQAGLWITPIILRQVFGNEFKFAFNANQKQYGLNSPLSNASFSGELSQIDLIALDVIGWDVNPKFY